MKEELNIAAILKEKPVETKLWSPAIGECSFRSITMEGFIMVKADSVIDYWFSTDGKLYNEGECLLFPSKQMRDWSKFAWKKGDVLVYIDGEEPYYTIFESFEDDEYTAFKSRYNYSGGNHWLQFNSQSSTNHFAKASDDEAKEFIKKVEEHYGGKLNLETLEIKKPKQEFKDGDIVHYPAGDITDEAIFIAKVEAKGVLHSYVYMSKDSMKPYTDSLFSVSGCLDSLRLATESEKQQLFDALAKKNKRWNPDTLQIEDLPKKCEFKPMDWCLMRDIGEMWKLCQFGFFDKKNDFDRAPYNAVGGNWYNECIPYNDQTKHLLGTTDKWKGGDV